MWRILFLEKSQKSVFRNFLILRILDWSALIWQNGNLEQNMQPSGRGRIIKNIFQYKSFEETWETHFWNSANNFSFIRPLQQLFKRGYEELWAGGQDIVGKLWQQLVTRISLSPILQHYWSSFPLDQDRDKTLKASGWIQFTCPLSLIYGIAQIISLLTDK